MSPSFAITQLHILGGTCTRPRLATSTTMTDLTPIFNQCVQIVTKELLADVKPVAKKTAQDHLVRDTFTKECGELYANLLRLSTFTSSIRSLYLQISDERSDFSHSTQKALTVEDKNSIDEEFKLKIQQVYEKLKYLQTYERKRNQAWVDARAKSGLRSLFSTNTVDPQDAYNTTLFAHRMNILRFLSDSTQSVNRTFEKMHQQRYLREKQLNLLHFQNLDDSLYDDTNLNLDLQAGFDVVEQSDTRVELSQQQIQEFAAENQEFLEMKSKQFELVEKLHQSMVDIVKLQAELTLHLETQAEQIETLLDNQDIIDLDLRQGNKNLAKATDRNRRGSNIIITTCIVLGLLLLFVDYIS